MKKIKDSLIYLIGIFLLLYLIIDIPHFYLERYEPKYIEFSESFYENSYISIFKWTLCVLGLSGIWYERRENSISYFLLMNAGLGIVMLFFLKGSFPFLVKGSFVGNIGLLEVCGISLIVFSNFFTLKKYNITIRAVLINLFVVGVLYWLLFSQLEPFRDSI